jgi:hypothetical protein
LFAGANFTLLIMMRRSVNWQKFRIGNARKSFYQAWRSSDYSGLLRCWRIVATGWLLTVAVFAQWPGVVAGLFLIAVKEYSIWWIALNEETFRHIGQWGVLIGTVLLFSAVWWLQQHQHQHQAATAATTATAATPATTAMAATPTTTATAATVTTTATEATATTTATATTIATAEATTEP